MNFSVERSLIERARGDREALNDLIERIWPEVYRVCIGIVRDRMAAEDAAQEACASIARGIPSLHEAGAFYGWMYRIAGRCAVDAEKTRCRNVHQPERDVPIVDDTAASIDLHAAILKLPLAPRAAVVLTYFAGLRSSEVAAALHVPSPTVRFHLMLARRRLRELLSAGLTGTQEACERA